MRLEHIRMQNFRVHADTEIDFRDDAVTGIVGANESGKSSVLEAIEWALFGAGGTRGNKDTIRWRHAAPRQTASVEFTFEVGGHRYLIERGENNAKMTDLTEGGVVAEGTLPVSTHAETILRLGHEEFRSSFLCAQKDLSRLGGLKPTERIRFIRRVLGMGKIDEALKECRREKARLAEEIRGMEAGLGDRDTLDAHVEAAEEKLSEATNSEAERRRDLEAAQERSKLLETAFAETDDKKQRYEATFRDLNQNRDRINDAEEKLEGLDRRLSRSVAAEAEAEERAKATEGKEEAVTTQLADLANAASLRERWEMGEQSARQWGQTAANIQSNLEKYQSIADAYDKNAHKEASARLQELRDTLRSFKAEREEAVQDLRARLVATENEAAKHSRRIEALEKVKGEGECPTCLRELGDQYEAVMGSLRALRAEAVEASDALKAHIEAASVVGAEEREVESQVRALETAVQEADDKRRASRDAMLHVGNLLDELASAEESHEKAVAWLERNPEPGVPSPALIHDLEEEKKRLVQDNREIADLRALARQAPEIREQAATAQQEKDAYVATFNELEASLIAIDFNPIAYTEAKEAYRNHEAFVVRLREMVAGASATTKAAREALTSAQDAVKAYEDRAGALSGLRDAHLLHERVDARLSEFRVAVATTIRPELEELMSAFVSVLTDGRHEAVELSEDFTPTLYESGMPSPVVSGGTEDIAALGMRLALSFMISERAGHPLSLLILDEPFGSLDEVRRGNVLTLIESLRGVFKQVVVISHVAETRDAVDHVIELHFDPAARQSRVEVSAVA